MADGEGAKSEIGNKRKNPVLIVAGREYPLRRAREAEPGKAEEMAGAGSRPYDDYYDDDDDDDGYELHASHVTLEMLLQELKVDEEKCRQIRRQYRQLIHNIQQQREHITNTSSESLTEALQEADVLFDSVIRTREAALDAQFLVLASVVGKEKAKLLNSDMSSFNPVVYRARLLELVEGNRLEEDLNDLDDCSESVARTFWETVHRKAAPWTLQAEVFHFLCGSFKSQPTPRKIRPRKRVQSTEESRDMPAKLSKMDLCTNQVATEEEVERILGLLQAYFTKYPDTPVSYFEFVVDPNSFSRTVENIFYVSFIIRDGFARIRLDQDRLPILEPININQVHEGNDLGCHGRKQGVITLSLQDWKNIVTAFEISEAMITSS